jgi:hypothetical protein
VLPVLETLFSEFVSHSDTGSVKKLRDDMAEFTGKKFRYYKYDEFVVFFIPEAKAPAKSWIILS